MKQYLPKSSLTREVARNKPLAKRVWIWGQCATYGSCDVMGRLSSFLLNPTIEDKHLCFPVLWKLFNALKHVTQLTNPSSAHTLRSLALRIVRGWEAELLNYSSFYSYDNKNIVLHLCFSALQLSLRYILCPINALVYLALLWYEYALLSPAPDDLTMT